MQKLKIFAKLHTVQVKHFPAKTVRFWPVNFELHAKLQRHVGPRGPEAPGSEICIHRGYFRQGPEAPGYDPVPTEPENKNFYFNKSFIFKIFEINFKIFQKIFDKIL